MAESDGPYLRANAQLQAHVDDLRPEAKVLLALACAERLVRARLVLRTEEVAPELALGWTAAATNPQLCASALDDLEARADLDDDDTAATAYALQAILGDPAASWFAVSRLLDDAFERVATAQTESSFRPLDVDFDSSVVQEAYGWLNATIEALQNPDDDPEFVRNRGQTR